MSVARITSKADFNRVYRKGRSISGQYMYIKFTPNFLTNSRLKTVVSKKISNKAVVRNKNRRRVDEIIRTRSSYIVSGYDMILFLLKDTANLTPLDLEKEVTTLMVRARLLNV